MPVAVRPARSHVGKVGTDPLRSEHHRLVEQKVLRHAAALAPVSSDVRTGGNDFHFRLGAGGFEHRHGSVGVGAGQILKNRSRQPGKKVLRLGDPPGRIQFQEQVHHGGAVRPGVNVRVNLATSRTREHVRPARAGKQRATDVDAVLHLRTAEASDFPRKGAL